MGIRAVVSQKGRNNHHHHKYTHGAVGIRAAASLQRGHTFEHQEIIVYKFRI